MVQNFPKFAKAKKELEALKEQTNALLLLFNEQKPFIIAEIPKLLEQRDLDELDRIACCFPGGIGISNSMMRELAQYYKENRDNGLSDAIVKLHPQSENYSALKHYLQAEPEILERECIDQTLAAFLSYPTWRGSEEKQRDKILSDFYDNGKKFLEVEDKQMSFIVKSATKFADIEFLLKAIRANIKTRTNSYFVLDELAANGEERFWQLFEHELKSRFFPFVAKVLRVDLDQALRIAAEKKNIFAFTALLRLGASITTKDVDNNDIATILDEEAPRDFVLALIRFADKKEFEAIDESSLIISAFTKAQKKQDVVILEGLIEKTAHYCTPESLSSRIGHLYKYQNTRALVALQKLQYYSEKDRATILSYALGKIDEDPYILETLIPALIEAGADPYEQVGGKPSLIDVIMAKERYDLLHMIRAYEYQHNSKDLHVRSWEKIQENKEQWLYCNSLLLKGVSTHNHDMVKAVLHYDPGAIKFRTPEGQSALHWAVQAHDIKMVKMLFAAGIDHTVIDEFGRSAYDLALHLGFKDLLCFFPGIPSWGKELPKV